MKAIINPGTEPIATATEQNAVLNMAQFVEDSLCATRFLRNPDKDYGDGRFAFDVFFDDAPGQAIEVQMPGLPLDNVRYLGKKGQNIWNYPRLYVDGSSWGWCYALIDCEMWKITNATT